MKITLLSNEKTASLGSFYDARAQKDLSDSFARSEIDFEIANVNSLSELELALANTSDLFWPNIYTFRDPSGIDYWPVEYLERYSLPFIGPNKQGLMNMIEKSTCQSIMREQGVPIPGFAYIQNGHFKPEDISTLALPVVVKPDADCASMGIYADSLAYTVDDVQRNIERIVTTLGPGVIVEEFLPGVELTVGIVSNNSDFFVVSADYDLASQGIKLRDRAVKEDSSYDTTFSLIKDEQLKYRLEELAKKVYVASDAKEFTRFDCRFDAQGNIKVFDVNAMPGMGAEHSAFPRYFFLSNPARPKTEVYDALLNTIVYGAANRYTIGVPAIIQEDNLFNPVYKK